MSAESLQASMQHESQCKKCCIAIGSIVHVVFFGCIGLVYCLWWRNADNIQSWFDSNCTENCDINLYDIGPLIYYDDADGDTSM